MLNISHARIFRTVYRSGNLDHTKISAAQNIRFPAEMIKNISVLLLFMLFLNIPCLYGEDNIRWQDCVEEAIKNHPDLVSAYEKVRQTRADRDISISPALPQVSAEASGKRAKSATTDVTSNTYAYGVSGRQLIFDGFKTASDVSSALKTIDAQQFEYDVISSNIRLALRKAFVELIKSQELITLTQDIAGRRTQNLRLVDLRYEAGREHKGSLLTAEADLARAEFETAQASRSMTLAQRSLSKELGYDSLKEMYAQEDLLIDKDYSVKPDFELMVYNTPFLRELIIKKEAARYNLQSSEADFMPKVYLNASSDATDSDWPPEHDGWSAGVSVTLPLFEGGSRIAEVSKARSKLRQAQADARSGHDNVLVTLETTWKDLQDAIAYVTVQSKFLQAARERAKIASAQYETGLTSFDDWIIIEDNLVNAKKAYLNAQADMLIAEAYWVQATGGTLEYDQE